MSSSPGTYKQIKALVVGDTSTGKTSLIKQYCHGMFPQHHRATIGVDFALKNIHVESPLHIGVFEPVQLQLWDIAGADHATVISRVFFQNAHAAFVVYDVTNPSTFDAVLRWKEEIDDKVQLPNGEPLPVVLLANKCDLEGASVDGHELDRICEAHGFVRWFKTSAKKNMNIKEATACLVEAVLSHDELFRHDALCVDRTNKRGLRLGGDVSKKSGWCC